jgi:predicted nucleic acid-binding protein
MSILVDASVLLRLCDPADARYDQCRRVLDPDVAARHDLRICAQSIIEYWVVATRPLAQNGYELSPAEVGRDVIEFRAFLPNLPEPADISERWLRLVMRHAVKGKPSHDARLAALMEAHGVPQLLTLNPRDFSRYSDLKCVSPAQLDQEAS